ncbi:MAG: hypothetical protein Q7U83_13445 [Daejeonella sp.]|nr:hypothetical protein [Daejeonella sp.]
MNRIIKLIGLFMIQLSILSCQKDSVGDGKLTYTFKPVNLSASLSSVSSASGQAVSAGSNGSINWTTGRFNVHQIELSGKKDGTSISIEHKDLTDVDILKLGTISGTVTLPVGTYKDIEVKLKFAISDTKRPLTLVGKFIETSGTQIPVEVHFNETLVLQKNVSSISINGDKYTADIILEVNNLVKNLTLSDFGQTTRGTNGSIFVSNTVNTALYNKLKANLSLVPAVTITRQ